MVIHRPPQPAPLAHYQPLAGPGPGTAPVATSTGGPGPGPVPGHEAHTQSSEEDSCGSWTPSSRTAGSTAPGPVPPSSSSHSIFTHQRSTINRQMALNTLAAMHRRFNLPGIIPTGGRPQAEFRASANKSLDILRQNIQAAVTKEIDLVIKKYLEKFFVPAVNNIRTNLGEESVGEEQVRAVCRAMLDGARCLYAAPPRLSVSSRAAPSPSELSDSESSNGADSRFGRPSSSPSYGKRKESDTDSDAGVNLRRKKKNENTLHSARKWDPARLNPDTLFIMGSIANKVLGLGQSRGRLYSKHSGLLRYPADSADKEWIANQNMTTPAGGRTYIMVLEDIEELVVSEGYRHSPALRLDELSGFRAPPFMLKKIQTFLSKRGQQSEDYASSTPTPTPPPEIKSEIKLEDIDEPSQQNETFKFDDSNLNVQFPIKTENIEKTIKMELLDDNSIPDDDRLHNEQLNLLSPHVSISQDSSNINNDKHFWRCLSNPNIHNSNPDLSNIKTDLSTTEFIDADMFLNSEFCNYVNDADIRRQPTSQSQEVFGTNKGNILSIDSKSNLSLIDQATADQISGNQSVSTIISSLPTTTQNVFAVSNAALKALAIKANLPSTHIIHQSQGNISHTASAQTSTGNDGNVSIALQPNIILPTGRSIHSIQNSQKLINTAVTQGQAIIGFGTRPAITGNIINSGNFINIPSKNISSGNILHNAIVSRNMVNRSFQINRFDVAKTVIGSTITTIVPATLVNSPQASHSRTTTINANPKIEDDSSITTTKAMIDNTCNSSAMLKKVLTLGSANVNKTFLTPPSQKLNPAKNSFMSSNLSASHATLSALLSGSTEQNLDKNNPPEN